MIISENGVDSIDCGHSISCLTIGFVLSHRAANSDIIKIENSRLSKPFFVYKSFSIPHNITLQGIKGRPTISTPFETFLPVYLFEENDLQFITLRVINLHFKGVGIVRLVNTINSISFQDCHFENIYTNRDFIRIEGHSSELHHVQAYFRQCHFINNVVSIGISLLKTSSVFDKCHFENNLSVVGLILIFSGEFSTLKNCLFRKNSPLKISLARSGPIYAGLNSFFEIIDCSFKGNEAREVGIIHSDGKKLVIKSSLFENNAAVNRYAGKASGGSIMAGFNCDAEIVNCSFIANKATHSGGAVTFLGKKLIIKSSIFEYNRATSNTYYAFGGAVNGYSNSEVQILNCLFKRNNASFRGGAILALGKQLVIKSSLFEYNTAYSGGAVAFLREKELITETSIFEKRRVKRDTDHAMGEAVHGSFHSKVQIVNCSFIGNYATNSRGGGIYIDGYQLVIQSSLFKYNSGGAVTFVGKELVLKSSQFEDNTALSNHTIVAVEQFMRKGI